MYNSPIDLLVTEIQNQIVKQQDEDIYQAVLHYIPNVKKDELIRALQYDRNQYEKGYMDGKADAVDELVRCKDCKHWKDGVAGCTDKVKCCDIGFYMIGENGYCSFGERR